MKKIIILIILIFFFNFFSANSYPIFAQQNYKNPRESNGRIVCANCHLGQKAVNIFIPQSVLPDIVFKAIVDIPYDIQIKQVLGNGKEGELNIGAVLLLPNGFFLSPPDRISKEILDRIGTIYFQSYSVEQKNIIVVGPIPGKKFQKIIFPILSPIPKKGETNYIKYPIYLGGNRGRGQIYPDGSKSNNTIFNSPISGVVSEISPIEKKGGFQIFFDIAQETKITEKVPPGPEILVKIGEKIERNRAITNNPNIGGSGQIEGEIEQLDSTWGQIFHNFFWSFSPHI